MIRTSNNSIRWVSFTFRGVVIIIAILFIGLGVMIFIPTELTYCHNTRFVGERVCRDLSINSMEFVAGRFHRESILVYRVQRADFVTSKFSQVIVEKQKRECVKRVSEIMDSCGIEVKVSLSDDFFVFYGNDYSVILLKEELNTYLIYLGAQ